MHNAKTLQSTKIYTETKSTVESYLLHKRALTTLQSVPFSSLSTNAHNNARNHTQVSHSDLFGVVIPDIVTISYDLITIKLHI